MDVRDSFNKERLPEDFYFIMRTTTNGMPRYNRSGDFNNSCHFSRPGMNPIDVEKIIVKYNKLFNENNITFLCKSYKELDFGNENDFVYLDPPYENTKGMYFGGFQNDVFIEWTNTIKCRFALSYDGKVNDDKINHISPNYVRHFYLTSGNSSFRRVVGNSNDSIVSESLYLNY
jgi:DNA adenine methylase